MVNHIVGVTGGQLAHESHDNEPDRQFDVTTRRLWARRSNGKLTTLAWRPSVLVSKDLLNIYTDMTV